VIMVMLTAMHDGDDTDGDAAADSDDDGDAGNEDVNDADIDNGSRDDDGWVDDNDDNA